jgi:hypothetical protein
MNPVKVGICGAPGTDKSSLAIRLSVGKGTNDLWEDTPAILDNYVEELSNGNGLAYGEWADYIGNLQVAMKRYEWERVWWTKNMPTITVGTILDTIVYASLYADLTLTYDPREKIAVYRRAEVAMATLGMLLNDTLAYDYIFWLPYREDNKSQNPFYLKMDEVYRMVFETNGISVVYLDEPDRETNFRLAEYVIREVEKKKRESKKETTSSATVDKSGVREGGKAGEEVGDSTEPVPDVSSD